MPEGRPDAVEFSGHHDGTHRYVRLHPSTSTESTTFLSLSLLLSPQGMDPTLVRADLTLARLDLAPVMAVLLAMGVTVLRGRLRLLISGGGDLLWRRNYIGLLICAAGFVTQNCNNAVAIEIYSK